MSERLFAVYHEVHKRIIFQNEKWRFGCRTFLNESSLQHPRIAMLRRLFQSVIARRNNSDREEGGRHTDTTIPALRFDG